MVEIINFGIFCFIKVFFIVIVKQIWIGFILTMKAGKHVAHFRTKPPRLIISWAFKAFNNFGSFIMLDSLWWHIDKRRRPLVLKSTMTFMVLVLRLTLSRLLIVKTSHASFNKLKFDVLETFKKAFNDVKDSVTSRVHDESARNQKLKGKKAYTRVAFKAFPRSRFHFVQVTISRVGVRWFNIWEILLLWIKII